MIHWFTIAQVVVACVTGVVAAALGIAGRRPGDATMLPSGLVVLLLLVQGVVAIVAPLSGNAPTGSLPEFWIYLVSALLVEGGALFWALLDRTRWSTLILSISAFCIAVMVYRMYQIWTAQGA